MSGPVAISLSLDYKSLLSVAQAAPDMFRNTMGLALGKSARAVQAYARATHRFTSRSGNLERSVDYTVDADNLTATIELDQAVAFYGLFIHEGTGTWGPKGMPYPIYPKAKKCLRFVAGDGSVVYAKKVMHPGIRPDQFLYEAAAAQESQIQAIFDRAVADMVARMEAM